MTQTPTRPEPAEAAAADETQAAAGTEAAAEAQTQTPDPGTVIAALEAEKTELKDKLLRTLADMENMRRRTEREVADARTYGVTGFARDMLNVADNVRRALETLTEEARASEGPIKALIEGIELTERDLLKTLERHGVRKLNPAGQKFDPNLHQAMFEVEDPNTPNGTVVQVVQAGFVIGDRVLRPALVGVSKGGPKPAAANGGAEQAAGE
jgi:molecular chaperone GrpE